MEDNLFHRSSKAHGIARQGLAQGSTSAIVNLVSCPRNNIYCERWTSNGEPGTVIWFRSQSLSNRERTRSRTII